jgi:anaerobic magnesium-protoporphyrin IX monomethyl ester cyclase
MRCSLVNPPLWDPSCPPLGLAYISAILDEKNIHHEIIDSNLDFMNYADSYNSSALDPAKVQSTSKSALLQAGLIELNKLYPNLTIEHFDLQVSNFKGDLREIRKVALEDDGLFFNWIRQSKTVSKILSCDPDWIGLSVSLLGQLPAALAIAAECKKKSSASIIFGGALFKDFESWIGDETPFWDLIDGIIIGAGESVIRCLEIDKDSIVRPTRWRKDLTGGGWIASQKELLEAPRPDFSHFPLNDYRSEKLVLPYRVFSHCSWGKCKFCADEKYSGHFPVNDGDPSSIASELIFLTKKYSAEGIYFLDAELPVQFMIELGKKLIEKKIRWGANVRFDKLLADSSIAEALYKSGCRFLRFGLESASSRILKLMNKGVNSKIADNVLSSVHKSGIATHIYLMHGYPGELREDWIETRDFLLRNVETVDMYNVSSFMLYDGSPLFHESNPDQIHFAATQDRWIHPKLISYNIPKNDISELEEIFFSMKETTRCHPTPAETILLGDKVQIKFKKRDI